MPRPRSKETPPEIIKAAKETAWQHLYRLCVDVASWSDQGVVAHPGSRRKHAVEFIGAALDPDLTTESMRRTAHNIAHPIIAREKDSRGRPSDARRDQIIVDAIEAVCKVHDLRPTRMGQGECGCSIVATAIEEFIAGCHSPQLRELSRKLFPKGPLSEDSIKTIWKSRTKAN